MVTVVSHAGIANRIKNLLSAISQHGDVSTLHDTISFIFPSIKKVDEVEEEYPEDWRLYVDSEEEKHIPDYKTALKWYNLSSEQGNELAQYNLGRLYYLGNGVKEDMVYAHCDRAAFTEPFV